MTDSATLWTVAYQASPSMGSPGENTGMGCHFFLQGFFPAQDRPKGGPTQQLASGDGDRGMAKLLTSLKQALIKRLLGEW